MRRGKGAYSVRYRYLAYKYIRRGGPEAAFQDFWESFTPWPMRHSVAWHPPTDIYETADNIIVVVELGGVAEDAVAITLFSDLLVVEGTREQPLTDMSACHQLGIQYGDFRSEIPLYVPVNHEKVNVDHKSGLLKITLRKLY